MREFFSGWRRKIGVLTLVMACVLMAGWVKSILAIDIAVIPFQANSAVTVFSEDQLFGVQYQFEPLGLHRTTRLSWVSHATAHHISKNLFPDARLTWHYRIRGFGCAEYLEIRENGSRLIFWLIPYWSIVLPLTLFSAFLLLSKPKTSNQKIIDEPTANEGSES